MSEQQHLSEAELQEIFDRSPFLGFSGLKVVAVDHANGRLTVEMPFRAEFERRAGSGQFHGGPIASFIDTVGDFAVGMALGGGVPTINFRVDYLRPAKEPRLTAIATVRKAGRTVAVVDIDVLDADGKLVAVGRGCYSGTTG